ncbi:MAG: hypothetical protein HC921_15250 [Synechococcaceae cyanobacterium SM2_3_1]|nr:hypothetical protein [Synechococcaceae cyanobacterium SM2_3_1]
MVPLPKRGILILSLCLLPLAPVVKAHTIKTDEEVGATFHLEPDHNPQAGEVALVWFALTRRGGAPIPLQDCECQLQIFQHPYTPDADPLLSPPLQPLSVESFADIPSAEIIFPNQDSMICIYPGEFLMIRTPTSFSLSTASR